MYGTPIKRPKTNESNNDAGASRGVGVPHMKIIVNEPCRSFLQNSQCDKAPLRFSLTWGTPIPLARVFAARARSLDPRMSRENFGIFKKWVQGTRMAPARSAVGVGVGVCWVFTMFAFECKVRLRDESLPMLPRLVQNVLQSLRANPGLPLCVLTSMHADTFRDALAQHKRWKHGTVERATFLDAVQIVTVPCVEHENGTRGRCNLCEQAARFVPATRETASVVATRYSRLVKTLSAAYVPFTKTLLIDADVALCAGVQDAVEGAADGLARLNASVGVRFFNALGSPACDEACAGEATVRTQMECLTLCVNARRTGDCSANTGVLLVRRAEASREFARRWHGPMLFTPISMTGHDRRYPAFTGHWPSITSH
jgi:hypothetical protein